MKYFLGQRKIFTTWNVVHIGSTVAVQSGGSVEVSSDGFIVLGWGCEPSSSTVFTSSGQATTIAIAR